MSEVFFFNYRSVLSTNIFSKLPRFYTSFSMLYQRTFRSEYANLLGCLVEVTAGPWPQSLSGRSLPDTLTGSQLRLLSTHSLCLLESFI